MAPRRISMISLDAARGDNKLTQMLAALVLVVLLACLVIFIMSGLKPVPDVVGLTKAEAVKVLEAAGLKAGTIAPRTATAEQDGKIVEQMPKAGERVASGSAISLTVGKAGGVSSEGGEEGGGGVARSEGTALPEWNGNPPREETIVPYDSAGLPSGVRVPSVMGMSQSAALHTLSEAGLGGSIAYGKSTTAVPVGTVFAQKPSAESYVPAGTTVVIYLSGGPPAGSPYSKAPYTN